MTDYKKAELEERFKQYVSFGSGAHGPSSFELDSAKLTKLCKETGIYTKKCTSIDSDIIFNKIKT